MQDPKQEAGQGGELILHKPVMLKEVLSFFSMLTNPSPLVIDCTLGAGGHAEAILE